MSYQSLPCSLPSGHTGRFAVPQRSQAGSCLRALRASPTDTHMVLFHLTLKSLFKCHLLQSPSLSVTFQDLTLLYFPSQYLVPLDIFVYLVCMSRLESKLQKSIDFCKSALKIGPGTQQAVSKYEMNNRIIQLIGAQARTETRLFSCLSPSLLASLPPSLSLMPFNSPPSFGKGI